MNTFLKSLTYSMLLLAVLPASVQAQAVIPDAQGNYYRNGNENSVRADRPSRYGTGSLWRVVVDGLNCRRSASIDSDVIRTFLSDELLESDIGRGGSDEVLINARDSNGKPWMRVYSANIESRCYVRANNRYIYPLTLQ
jgi:hypothetical protein